MYLTLQISIFFFFGSENTVSVMATVVEHTRLKKVIVFKKKRRKNYKRTKGRKQFIMYGDEITE